MLVASPMLFNANSARAEPGVAVGNGEGTVLLTCSDGSQEEVSGEIPSFYSPNPKSAEALGL